VPEGDEKLKKKQKEKSKGEIDSRFRSDRGKKEGEYERKK